MSTQAWDADAPESDLVARAHGLAFVAQWVFKQDDLVAGAVAVGAGIAVINNTYGDALAKAEAEKLVAQRLQRVIGVLDHGAAKLAGHGCGWDRVEAVAP